MKKPRELLGLAFSKEEEKEGVIEEISKPCNFDNLKDLKVNKAGVFERARAPNKYLVSLNVLELQTISSLGKQRWEIGSPSVVKSGPEQMVSARNAVSNWKFMPYAMN
ncbi:unnamed protein product [Dovyalis caffra]|uniref:Uncharacterized protein n=1 Tax=Dovyalis caffra TaxID=77055 RepID=A0AAV1S8Q9_9ROSI|nr:unnamed protein product [Dovyalis caffra]